MITSFLRRRLLVLPLVLRLASDVLRRILSAIFYGFSHPQYQVRRERWCNVHPEGLSHDRPAQARWSVLEGYDLHLGCSK